MSFIAVFWFLFLIDSIIVLFSFIVFICIWVSLLFILSVFFILTINTNNYYLSNDSNNSLSSSFIYWDFVGSNYIDFYWFVLGTFFVIGLLSRLCLLLYFGSANFLCFDLCNVIGFQWYWIYQTSSNNSNFSNLVLESDYFIGDLRLLQTNHVLTLLSLVVYNLWLTSIDVIHSFTISSLGIKVDCIPGSCNELTILSSNEGCFYGQCSELCGVLHGFMPICIQFI